MIGFGCAIVSPHQVATWLENANITKSILPVGFNSCEHYFQVRTEAILVLTYADFKQNLQFLNSKRLRHTKIFVFAPVVRFKNIAPISILDVQDLEPNLLQPYRFCDPMWDKIKTATYQGRVAIHNVQYIPQLIQNALSGSILTQLMTNLYQIPNGKVQNEYRDAIIAWFVLDEGDLPSLQAKVGEITNKDVRTNLLHLLEHSKSYRQVFAYIRNNPNMVTDYVKCAAEYKVHEFDIRYMRSIASKINFSEREPNSVLA